MYEMLKCSLPQKDCQKMINLDHITNDMIVVAPGQVIGMSLMLFGCATSRFFDVCRMT